MTIQSHADLNKPFPWKDIMRKKLLKLYDDLYAEYGELNWWPAETPFEIIIGAILGQATAWGNAAKAIDNLKAANLLNPEGLGKLSQDELETLILPSGYYRAKAKKVRAFLTHLQEYHNNRLDSLFAQELPTLRKELLSIYGIGEETADAILLYAAKKPSFVVDTYTYRLLGRLGWFSGKYHYGKLQEIFMDNLPHDCQLFNQFHALIVRHGARICQKTPQCEKCILRAQCPTGKESRIR
jgi:endonuclease-3 related protein